MKINKKIKGIFLVFVAALIGSVSLWKNIKASAAFDNLIANPSVEEVSASNSNLPNSWYKDFYGNNTRSFSYPVAGQDGNKAIKIEIKKINSGDAKWAFNDVKITGGQKFEFSDYYQSNVKSYLIVRYLYKSGIYRYFDIATLDPANNWTQKKVELITPNNAVSMTMYHLIKNVGWLSTDNFSLIQLNNNSPTSVPTLIPTNTPAPTTAVPTTIIPTTADTPTPTNVTSISPTETISISPTLIPTIEPSISPNITETPILSPTITLPTETPIISLSPTDTPIITPTDTPTPTGIPTVEPTIVPTLTPVPSSQVTPTPTSSVPSNLGLVLNGTLEDTDSNTNLPTHWAQGNWGSNSVTFTYPVSGNNSNKASKVQVNSITDGDAKWYFDDVAVESGANYIFSDNYISDVSTRIVARFKLNDGTFSYQDIGTVNPTSAWQSTNQNISIPINVVSLSVFHLIDKVGSLTIDNASLNKQVNPNALSTGLVSLDFDDGWDSTFQNGLPIINGAGFRSTLYIISRYVGEPSYVTGPQIISAQNAGNEIGAHSKTHPELPLLTQAQMQDEIAGSKQDLLNLGAKPINSFSYPYGEYNDTILSLTQAAGYQSARTALIQDGGFNDKSTNPYLLKTQSVESTTTLSEIQGWIDNAIKNKTWLILVMHQVDNTGSQYSITPQKLQSIVDYLKTNNTKVVTISEGMSYLK